MRFLFVTGKQEILLLENKQHGFIGFCVSSIVTCTPCFPAHQSPIVICTPCFPAHQSSIVICTPCFPANKSPIVICTPCFPAHQSPIVICTPCFPAHQSPIVICTPCFPAHQSSIVICTPCFPAHKSPGRNMNSLQRIFTRHIGRGTDSGTSHLYPLSLRWLSTWSLPMFYVFLVVWSLSLCSSLLHGAPKAVLLS